MNKTENGRAWLGHLALALVLALSLLVIPLAVPLLGPTPALAATITTTGNGNWNSTVNNTPWPGGVVPGTTDAVVIAAGHTVYIPGDYTGTCGDIAVNGTLKLYNTAGTLHVFGGGTSPVTTGKISGVGTIDGPSDGGTNVVFYGDWSFSGTLTDYVSFYFYGSQDQNTAGGKVAFPRNLFIEKSGGTVYFPVTPTWTYYFHITGDAGTVCYNGGAQSVAVPASGYSYYNLALAGSGTKTLPSGITQVNGNLALSGTASATTTVGLTIGGNLDVGSGTNFTVAGFSITVNGTTTVDGTLTISSTTGTKTFTGDVIINSGGIWSETVSESISFGGNLQNDGTLTGGTGTHTFSGSTKTFSGANQTSIPSVTVSGTYTNNGILNVSTALAGGGGLTQGTSATLNIGGTSGIATLTANATGNTVNYTGAGQTVKATTYHHLTLSGSGAKTMTSVSTINGNFNLLGTATATALTGMTIGGSVTIGSGTTFSAGTYTHNVGGDWTNGGTFTAGTSTINLNGSGAQTMTGATTFYKMTLNNSYGLTINNDETISNTLTLTNGKITTDSNKVIIPASGAVTRTNGYVIGNLQKNVATGSSVSRTFEVGTASGYNPVAVTFASVSTAGNLIAKATSGDHPSIGSSTIDATKSVNVYWSLTNSGIVFTTYGATFNFNNPSDIDAGANTANFIVGKYSGTSWSYPTVGTKTTTSTPATGMTSFGDFAVGEAVAAPTVTTQDATSVEATTATGNGNITATGGRDCDKRGFVYDTSSHGLPGNVAPASSGYASYAEDTGLFGIGDFTKGLTSLSTGTTYYARAYAHNSVGYSYGGEVSFTTTPPPATIEITAPTDITGWALSPQGDQPKTTTGTLNVTSNSNWTVTVKDADAATGGKMTDWNGSAYGTTKLSNFMTVAAQTYEVTLPTEGTIASGSGNANVTVTFKQTVSWSDQVLPGGHSYRIIVTFTGTTITP